MAATIPVLFSEKYLALDEKQRIRFDMQFQSEAKDPTIALICSLFGVYHFYMGQIGLGILFLFLAGGCGIWALITIIGAKKSAEKHNQELAQRIFLTMS